MSCDGGEYAQSIRYFKKGTEEWGTPFDFTVSLKESEKPSDVGVEIYPNPAKDEINIHSPAQNGKVFLYDVHGRLRFISALASDHNIVDITTLPAGMYFVKVSVDSISYMNKLLVE